MLPQISVFTNNGYTILVDDSYPVEGEEPGKDVRVYSPQEPTMAIARNFRSVREAIAYCETYPIAAEIAAPSQG